VWPYHGTYIEGWYNVVLSTLSAVTTVLYLLGSVWAVLHGPGTLRRISAWVFAGAFFINGHWYIRFGSDRMSLEIGYFLWWFSYGLLALGLFLLSPQTDSFSSDVKLST